MFGHLAVWIELHGGDRDRVLADQALLIRMARWGHEAGYGERALLLLRAVEESLILAGRWESARRVSLVVGVSAVAAAIPALALATSTSAGAASASGVSGGSAGAAGSAGTAGSAGGSGAAGALVTGKTIATCLTAATLATGGLSGAAQAADLYRERQEVSGALSIPREVAFGRVQLGWHRDRTITVANVGSSPNRVTPTMTSSIFSVAGGTCRGTLRPGGTCTVTVRFQPDGGGSRTAVLLLGTASVALSGTGLPTLTSGELTGFFRVSKVAYSCRIAEAPEVCSGLQQQVQPLVKQLEQEAKAAVMPVRQVVPCAGNACAYRVDDAAWGSFTIHPYAQGGYTVLDSGLQADVQAQVDQSVQAFRDALAGSGATVNVRVVQVTARLTVRGKGSGLRIVVSAWMTAQLSGPGVRPVTLNSVESYTYDFKRAG